MIINEKLIKDTLDRLNYKIFTRNFELNIIGIRNKDSKINVFNDKIVVFYYYDKQEYWHIYNATTKPGLYWLNNLINPKGTAILVPGQYIDVYKIGLHRGEYEALIQRDVVKVYRDNNHDSVIDYFNVEEGYFGINIHRRNKFSISNYINRSSAGCQVFEYYNNFNEFMTMADVHRNLYGNGFTYTLIEEKDLYIIDTDNLKPRPIGKV